MRKLEEFYCDVNGGGCGVYFKTYLRDSMWGNFSIECPACKHIHFRFIDFGLVTMDRHNDRAGQSEIIMGLSCTISKTPWHDSPEFKRSQLALVK